jgi:hypothetical protein
MGQVRIRYAGEFADDLADLVYFIESKGLKDTANKYIERVYAFIESLNFEAVNYAYCHNLKRAALGLKCIRFNSKYTIVFYQFSDEVIITNFVPSKMIFNNI